MDSLQTRCSRFSRLESSDGLTLSPTQFVLDCFFGSFTITVHFEMGEVDPIWLGAVLAKHSRDNSIVSVLSVTTEPAVGACDNYASVIVRATMKVVLGSGKITTKKVIMKKELPDLPPEVAVEMASTFNVEGIAYNVILSKYETLIFENGLNYGKLWADCLLTSHNLIILEDLKMSGFTLGTRKTGLDPVHARLVFTNLARLHSLSLVTVSTGAVFPKMLPGFLMLESPVGHQFFKTSLKALADVMRDCWSSEWSKVEKKIRSMIDDIIPTLSALYRQQPKLSVVNHGDCWVNNMMFKYDSQGSPVDIKFVDFQLSHYNSYAWDLAYFFHTSIHPKFISSIYDSMIEVYCQEFSRNLDSLGHDTSKAPTVLEVKEELVRLQPLSIVSACSVLPITANPSDIKLTLNDVLTNGSKVRLLFEDKEFEKTMQSMLQHFVNLGAL